MEDTYHYNLPLVSEVITAICDRCLGEGEEVKVYKRNGYYNSYYTVLSQTDSDQKVTVEIESYKDTNGNEGDSYILIPSKSTLTIVKKGTIIKDIK